MAIMQLGMIGRKIEAGNVERQLRLHSSLEVKGGGRSFGSKHSCSVHREGFASKGKLMI